MTRTTTISLVLLLLSCVAVFAQSEETAVIKKYQLWYDGEYTESIEGTMPGSVTETLELSLDVSSQKEGIHTLSYRFADDKGCWSPVDTWLYMVYPTPVTKTVTHAEYWIDQKFESTITVALTNATDSFVVDASALSEGIHTISYRVRDDSGGYSPVSQWGFFKTTVAKADTIAAIEYWLDSCYTKTVRVDAVNGENMFVIDTKTLGEGMHTLSYRALTKGNKFSVVSSSTFYKFMAEPTDSVNAIEYWVDSLYDERKTVAAMAGDNIFQVDASSLKEGVHTLSYRAKTCEGRFSSAGMWMFYKAVLETKATGIKWYKYWWNDRMDMAVKEDIDSVSSPYVFSKQLTVPDYARTGFNSQPLMARLNFVFGDDAGNVSVLTYADIRYPDVDAPVTEISADKKTAYTSVNISWSGTDEELKDYNVYVSENGLPYLLWLPNTTATTAEFKGEAGKTYRFTVTGRDRTGNIERFDGNKCATVKFIK